MEKLYRKILINSKLYLYIKANWVFIIFVLLHIFLFNINVAEWGDSYRILRAAEYIRKFSYPIDEKRPPLFSFILAIRPGFVEQVFWGRVVMFFISIASFWMFKNLCNLFLNKKESSVALLIFTLNPIYFYWSLRIMADVPFSLLVMSVIYFYLSKKEKLKSKDLLVLGFLSGLAILTRFEGYILTASVGLSMLLSRHGNAIKKSFLYGTFSLITILPWVIYRNPFTSSYFEETAGRSYDPKMFFIYVVSMLFMFGFTAAFVILAKNIRSLSSFFGKNLVLTFYIGIELVLILFWPAAIPRLFVAILPLLILILAKYFEDLGTMNKLFQIILLVVFMATQYFLRLQFLVSIKGFFVAIVLIQVLIIISSKKIIIKNLVFISMFCWLLSSIYVHKDIFIAVKNGASFAAQNLEGVIGYNDVSSVSDWYLNQKGYSQVSGKFFDYSKKSQLECENLHDLGFDYLLMTNEHNVDMTLDIPSRPYLKTVKEFEYEINNKAFFTKLIKINSCGV